MAALDALSKARAGEILARAIDPATRQLRSFLGFSRDHRPAQAVAVTVPDPAAWKRGQRYE